MTARIGLPSLSPASRNPLLGGFQRLVDEMPAVVVPVEVTPKIVVSRSPSPRRASRSPSPRKTSRSPSPRKTSRSPRRGSRSPRRSPKNPVTLAVLRQVPKSARSGRVPRSARGAVRTGNSLADHTLSELKSVARHFKVQGYSGLNKAQLVAFLLALKDNPLYRTVRVGTTAGRKPIFEVQQVAARGPVIEDRFYAEFVGVNNARVNSPRSKSPKKSARKSPKKSARKSPKSAGSARKSPKKSGRKCAASPRGVARTLESMPKSALGKLVKDSGLSKDIKGYTTLAQADLAAALRAMGGRVVGHGVKWV